MIVGYNHNVNYRGTTFHVQTEDSGLQRPQLTTLLYHGGTILSSKKTLYADIIKVDNLEQVIEELAKEQHKGMLRSLTRGEFDRRIVEMGISLAEPQSNVTTEEAAPLKEKATARASDQMDSVKLAEPASVIVAEPVVDKFRKSKPQEPSLDELIYAYLTAGR